MTPLPTCQAPPDPVISICPDCSQRCGINGCHSIKFVEPGLKFNRCNPHQDQRELNLGEVGHDPWVTWDQELQQFFIDVTSNTLLPVPPPPITEFDWLKQEPGGVLRAIFEFLIAPQLEVTNFPAPFAIPDPIDLQREFLFRDNAHRKLISFLLTRDTAQAIARPIPNPPLQRVAIVKAFQKYLLPHPAKSLTDIRAALFEAVRARQLLRLSMAQGLPENAYYRFFSLRY